ncbi:MAG: biotin--[acetyl-CoA-carboxylase] ligase, partial [Alphaproteobacteria bacterium]
MPLKLSQAPVLTYGSVTSTMDVARYLVLGSGKSNPIREIPFAVQSAEQLKGRGRLSSDWHSPTGNLYTSILLRPKLRPEHMALTSFAVVLALYDCIQANAVGCDPLDLKVKWPNDLLLEGGKI